MSPENHQEEDPSELPAKEQIRRFYETFGNPSEVERMGEELAACSRTLEALIRNDDLTTETLGALFEHAHRTIQTGATYILAYRAIAWSIREDKFSGKTLEVVEESVMADKDPLWTALDKQEEANTLIMQKIFLNEHLFNLMLPYISPTED